MNENPIYSVKELANWILDFAESRGQNLSNMALNKLIYFAYEYALNKSRRKLTGAKIEAWNHGPVFREVYAAFKEFGSGPIKSRAVRYNPRTNSVEIVNHSLAREDEALIIEAIEPLIGLPAFILREISHNDSGAWARVWNHKSNSNPGMEITDEIILHSTPATSLLT